MDGCSLFALIACFSWGNLYLDGGMSYQDAEYPHQEWVTQVNQLPGVTETVTQLQTTDEPFNPYGRGALGYEIRFRSVTISAEAFISGSMNNDGADPVNGFALKARWYPFR
jgi:hypothetical protein